MNRKLLYLAAATLTLSLTFTGCSDKKQVESVKTEAKKTVKPLKIKVLQEEVCTNNPAALQASDLAQADGAKATLSLGEYEFVSLLDGTVPENKPANAKEIQEERVYKLKLSPQARIKIKRQLM